MINPGVMMRLMSEKDGFIKRHPKFISFMNMAAGEMLEEGAVIEVTVTPPGKNPVTANMKVMPEDMEMIRQFKKS